MRKGQAGYSAFRRARQLQRAHLTDALKWGGWSSALSAGGATVALGGLTTVSLAAGGATGAATVVWRAKKPCDAKRWLQGAKAERRTGAHLRSLERLGWVVLHDRKIPKSKANLDHIAIHLSGRFLVYTDTKAWHAQGARIRWEPSRERLMYGPWNKTEQMKTVEWMASRLQEETGLPVVPVIACDRGNVVGPAHSPDLIIVGNTHIVRSDNLRNALAFMDQLSGPDSYRVKQVRKRIDRVFPPAQ